jgi:hypothetical protein
VALLEELDALAAVGDDRDAVVHRLLEIAALLGLPVDDERLGRGGRLDLAARALAKRAHGRRIGGADRLGRRARAAARRRDSP